MQNVETDIPGFTELEAPPEGMPERQRVRLTPLVEELRQIKRCIEFLHALDAEDPKLKVLQFMAERLRKRIWEAADEAEEKTPPAMAKLVGVTPDTIRNWCDDGHVRHRKTDSNRYHVDVESCLEYAEQR